MTVYLTADPHLGHRRVAEIRGFDDVYDHDDAVLASYVEKLKAGDDLWILGDVSASNTGETRALDMLCYLKLEYGFRLHLIAGNHDRCSPIHRESWKHLDNFLGVFDSVQAFARRRGPGRVPVFMSHFPYAEAGDGPHRDGARYLEYRLPDLGHWLLHGHTHQPEFRSGPRSLHVGWDAHRGPIPWSTIEEEIRRG